MVTGYVYIYYDSEGYNSKGIIHIFGKIAQGLILMLPSVDTTY